MALRVFKKGFLAHWATAKLHRFTVTCFFSSFLSFYFWFLLLMVLFLVLSLLCLLLLLLLYAGFPPSLSRHQTWALLRSVERALGSTNRITGVARAGVYGVCLHRPGPGEGCWVTVHWDFLLFSFFFLHTAAASSSLPPPFCLPRQATVTSQLPPATPCRSISRLSLFDFSSFLGRRVSTSFFECLYECFLFVCRWRDISGVYYRI